MANMDGGNGSAGMHAAGDADDPDAADDPDNPDDPDVPDAPDQPDDAAGEETARAARSVRRRAAGIVTAALAVVVATSIAIDQLTPEGTTDFGELRLEPLPVDVARAELADTVRTGLEALADAGATDLGGFAGSGRGWVFRADDAGYTRSIAEALTQGGTSVDDLNLPSGEVVDVLVHRCGNGFGVFVDSNVETAEIDREWWAEHRCSPVPEWLLGEPLFFVVSDPDSG